MPSQTRIVSPGPNERSVTTSDGLTIHVPTDWELLPPGDAGLTRRVKAAGPTWTVQEKVGRRMFSRGVWASRVSIESIRNDLAVERSTEAYAKRRESDANRRQKKQTEYVEDFHAALISFLRFDPKHAKLETRLAEVVAAHATPVGSGTVARTQRIPIEQRAESALIAWMRHQTTAYDHMKIARVKGKRREVRRMLAAESRRILEKYRRGDEVVQDQCPLQHAIEKSSLP